MLVGETMVTKDKVVYTAVNKQGTLERLCVVKWYARLYLEIRQGLVRPMYLKKIRSFVYKYQKI